MPTNFERVKAFHKKFNVPIPSKPTLPDEETAWARSNKIEEELSEFREEMATLLFDPPSNPEERQALYNRIVHEAGDVIYTFYGLMVSFGANADDIIAKIHEANMTKTLEGDKIVKGADFAPAQIFEEADGDWQ